LATLWKELVVPRKAITAHVLPVQPQTPAPADLDAWVAATKPDPTGDQAFCDSVLGRAGLVAGQ